MSQLDIHHRVAKPPPLFSTLLALLQRELGAIYTTPFREEGLSPDVASVADIGQQRRVGLFRLVAFNYTACLLISAVMLPVFFHASLLLRWSDFCILVLNSGCLIVSYYRWATLATIVFLLASFTFCLALIDYDIDALDERSVLIYSLISLLIAMAGMLLPAPIVWMVTSVMIVATLATVMILPLKMADPRLLIMGVLLTLYVVVTLLIWLYGRSTTLRIKTLVAALAYEQDLLKQKEAFINIASHELRTPLTTLVLDAHLLKRCLHHPERHDQMASFTSAMITHVKRMDAMLTLLLDASRISLDQFTLRKERCDITVCLREAVAEQERLTERHVAMQGVDAPILGVMDARRVGQVLTNLVGNALKFSATTAVVNVTVVVIQKESAPWLHVDVRDTGPGIPSDALPHLFERNYRAHDDTMEHQAGLGLGLYISGTICQLHGGALWVHSTLGEGSTFTFEIPL